MLAVGCLIPIILGIVGGVAGAAVSPGNGVVGAIAGFFVGLLAMLALVWGWERVRHRL